MKISICITYYNQKEFVKQSIDSVLSIDFPCEFEILCGDDGSTDGTLDIIKEYANKYPDNIRYFVTDKTETEKSINRASLNRLNLAQNATGDYIMFLDGDDFYCDKSFVKEAIEMFKENNNLSACAFNFKYLHTDNSEEIFKQGMLEGIINNKEYISKSMYTPAGACIFKNILNKKRLDLLKKINNFDDNAITIYFLQFGNLYYFNKPIYAYRQSENSLWNSSNPVEQNLLNAFDLKKISDSAICFKKELTKRQFGSIKFLYKNKHKLKEMLANNYDKYLNIAKNDENNFLINILKWNNLNILCKIKTAYEYQKYKFIKKTYTFFTRGI